MQTSESNYVPTVDLANPENLPSPSAWWLLLPVGLGVGWALPPLLDPATARRLLVEDGPYETASAILFFTAGAVLFVAWKRYRKEGASLLVLALALLFIFIAGEEVSWGQRIFGWSTPEGFDNVQGETTIHNLRWFDKQTAGRLSMSHMFEVFCIVYGALLPGLALRFKSIASIVQRFRVPLVPVLLGLAFPVNYMLSKAYQAGFDDEWVLRSAELREWAHAATWFAIACALYMTLRKSS